MTRPDPIALIERHYPPGSLAHRILLDHSRKVAARAEAIARRLSHSRVVDVDFVREAALLHDIGIRFTAAADCGCFGELPYLCHGYKGRELLEAEGLPRHGLVCERHIGVGLSAREIRDQKLPLPVRDMLPLSLEEQIVAYADLFFSKSPRSGGGQKPLEAVRSGLSRHGEEKVAIFDRWHALFAG